MSIAGGVDKAIERGNQLSCTAIQLFTKNANQWKGKPFAKEKIERFAELRKESNIEPIYNILYSLILSSAKVRSGMYNNAGYGKGFAPPHLVYERIY